MSLKIWIDGKFYDKADAKISVYDHGLLYGDGVFEGIRVYNGKIFECDAHLRRFYDSEFGESLFLDPTEIPLDLAEGGAYAGHPIRYREFFRTGELKEANEKHHQDVEKMAGSRPDQ